MSKQCNEKNDTGFSAFSPDADGCVAVGNTKKQPEKMKTSNIIGMIPISQHLQRRIENRIFNILLRKLFIICYNFIYSRM